MFGSDEVRGTVIGNDEQDKIVFGFLFFFAELSDEFDNGAEISRSIQLHCAQTALVSLERREGKNGI